MDAWYRLVGAEIAHELDEWDATAAADLVNASVVFDRLGCRIGQRRAADLRRGAALRACAERALRSH